MTGSFSSIQRLWVFSDLHLSDLDDSLYRGFLLALQEPDSSSDAVVFAGDIFEIFVGNSAYFTQKHRLFTEAVRALSKKNVQLFYIEGNHDFHLADAFPDTDIRVLDRELVLGKIYIAHGDLVDPNDRPYLFMRKIFRSPVFRKLVEWTPGLALEKIGEAIARPVEQKERDLSPKVRPVFRAFADEKRRQGFDFVVLGHCHDLDEVEPFYFNMGYPPVHRQFLFWSAAANSFKRRVFPGI